MWQPIETAPDAQASSDLAEAIIADMQAQYDSELITENDSGEALIRLDGAIAAVEDNFAQAQPAPSVPEGWIQRGMAELEAIRNRHDDDTLLNDRTLIERIGKAMLAAAPEAKP